MILPSTLPVQQSAVSEYIVLLQYCRRILRRLHFKSLPAAPFTKETFGSPKKRTLVELLRERFDAMALRKRQEIYSFLIGSLHTNSNWRPQLAPFPKGAVTGVRFKEPLSRLLKRSRNVGSFKGTNIGSFTNGVKNGTHQHLLKRSLTAP